MSKKLSGQSAYKELKSFVESSADSTREILHRSIRRQKYIGITGLSRSGKSTFITSFINQLLSHNDAKLGAFSPWVSKRIAAVKIHSLDDRRLPDFPYHLSIEGLTNDVPNWPEPTNDISGCLIEIVYKKKSRWRNTTNRDSAFIELRDYPGEWLLDLSLKEMDYADWCSQCAVLFNREPRASLLSDLLLELQAIDPLAPHDDDVTCRLHKRYCDFLKRCKNAENSLSMILPGRFLMPGKDTPPETLLFLPLLSCKSRTKAQLEMADKQSYFKTYERCYQHYISEIVEPFYKNFFRPIDRQIVLVDVINALNGGPEYIEDMRQAISNISDSFSYGQQSPIKSLFQPKIEKVIFAASKIDQVVAKDHDNVRQMVAGLVQKALQEAAYKGIEPKPEAIAAIRSSAEFERNGTPAIIGTDLQGKSIGYVHPIIPDHIPEHDEWQPFRDWKIPILCPPKGVRCDQGQALPHIRMDQILQALIGDLCQ